MGGWWFVPAHRPQNGSQEENLSKSGFLGGRLPKVMTKRRYNAQFWVLWQITQSFSIKCLMQVVIIRLPLLSYKSCHGYVSSFSFSWVVSLLRFLTQNNHKQTTNHLENLSITHPSFIPIGGSHSFSMGSFHHLQCYF